MIFAARVYTQENGVVNFEPNGTCQFQLQVVANSNPVIISYYDISSLIGEAISKHNAVVDGEDRVAAIGAFDCPEDVAEASWWVTFYDESTGAW